jgi:hypothetical protein
MLMCIAFVVGSAVPPPVMTVPRVRLIRIESSPSLRAAAARAARAWPDDSAVGDAGGAVVFVADASAEERTPVTPPPDEPPHPARTTPSETPPDDDDASNVHDDPSVYAAPSGAA